MEYEDIVREYKRGGLDTTSLKEKLEKARPLKARQNPTDSFTISFRAYGLLATVRNQQAVPEKPEKVAGYKVDTNYQLIQYFKGLIKSIGNDEAWGMLGIVHQSLSIEDFKELSIEEKIGLLSDLSNRYQKYIETQRYADLRELMIGDGDLQEESIQKMQFILNMFDALETDNEKRRFFCLSSKFISSLLRFRTSKHKRIEDYFEDKNKNMRASYKTFSTYFVEEEFRDIISNLEKAGKALKMPPKDVATYYMKMSELMYETSTLVDGRELLQELSDKNKKMIEAELQGIREKEEAEARARAEKEATEKRRIQEEKERLEAIERSIPSLRKKKLPEKEGSTGKDEEEQERIEKEITVKERIIPVLFIWADREGESLSKYATAKQLNAFFEKIKTLETKHHARAALYMITRANEETTIARIRDISSRAKAKGLKRFFDGALGGYGAFRVNADETITPLVKMSDQTRKDVQQLISTSPRANFPEEWIDPREQNYIRYFFSLKRDKSITEQYLKYMAIRAMNDPAVKNQPLEFNVFMEGPTSGIDVMLKEQAEIIKRIPAYIRSRYSIVPGTAINLRAEEIKEFVRDDEKGEEK